ATARYADQDDVGFLQPLDILPVVVRKREIDGLDARVVLLRQPAHVRTTHRMAGFHSERLFDILHEGAEQVEEDAVGAAQGFGDGRIDQRAEYQGRRVLVGRTAVDARDRFLCLLDAVEI